MNILIYTSFYPAPPELRTKPDTLMIHYFARELRRAGHTVQVVFLSLSLMQDLFRHGCRDIVPTEADYLWEGVPVHLFRVQSVVPHLDCPNVWQAALLNRRLKRFKDRLGWKADKVFLHFPTVFTGLTEIFAGGAPVLGDFHNLDITLLKKRYWNRGQGEKIAAFLRRIDTWAYRNNRVRQGLGEIDGREMIRSLSGIDAGLFAPEGFIAQKARTQPEVLRIVYAGQLIPLKNVDILIRAVKELSFPWQLTVVGDGPERSRLESLAGDTPQIRFTGRLSREETMAQMRAAGVFIMLSSPETYGLVYLEAMAQGCVTIASTGEGFDGLIVDGENGFLAQPGSVEAAVEVLERVRALEEDARGEMIRRGYAFALTMTEEQTARRFLEANR